MSVEEFLKEWNKKIREQRKDLLATAYGFSTSQEANKGWWGRNYLKMFIYSFFGLSLAVCCLFGFIWPFRILALMLILMVARALWTAIKKGWTWLKTYLAARRLLKQASRLKKE